MSTNSTRKPSPRRPDNRPKTPYPTVPLTPHASGKWMKKIRGKIFYFGSWARRVDGILERIPGDGWEDALTSYNTQAEDLHAGRMPNATMPGDVTVGHICDKF